MEKQMEIFIEKLSDSPITILKISGRVDAVTAPDLEKAVLDALPGSSSGCVLDLADVDYMSSAGLRVLVIGAKTATATKGVFSLAALQLSVKKVIDMVGFTPLLEIHTDRDGAVYAARKRLVV